MATKAGWYTDTEQKRGEDNLRYWDGTEWTERRMSRAESDKAWKDAKRGTPRPPYAEQNPWSYIALGFFLGSVISGIFFSLAFDETAGDDRDLFMFLGGSALLTGYTYALIGVIGAGVRLGMRSWDFDHQRMEAHKRARSTQV